MMMGGPCPPLSLFGKFWRERTMENNSMTSSQIELVARMVMEAMNQGKDTDQGYMVPVGV